MNKKVITALALSIPVLVSSGNMASAQVNTPTNMSTENIDSQKLLVYQEQRKQVVNIETAIREAIPGYVKYIHGFGESASPRVIINDIKLMDVEEKYMDPEYPIQSKLISRGAEKLVQSIEEDIYNDHPSAELTKSHTFQHAVSNASTLTKSITHSHKGGVKFTYKAKVNLIGADSEVGGEVSYEYTNSNQEGTSDSKTFSKTFSSTASAKLQPMSRAKLVSNVYTSPAIYEIKSRSFFTGSVQFSYVLSSNPNKVETKTVSLYELFTRTDYPTRDSIAERYHMWSQTFWNPESGEAVQALLFEGTSILNIDETYRTETRLKDIKSM
ncbi:hypothetical protein [Bacillus thuringiensis]|uniref:hypothetical protein n=1 Tax=Bacillus thuringiensis TaxID=1428 RepID=UPI000B6C9E44|nr:hypothetical protein [Bacillus thuringiensis]OUA87853.1 hypothetical protein BK706_18130 [Bacillus thuringiensis serovar leesis]OUA87949.1 hypothetical protein BK706_18055 [Bacillus thuringiensis serovar leesis]OUA91627.1 hypothetical protein BK706_10890 [Bacillus thuringiensis serovar leesis]OUA92134.1 hypothetical protein BK706_10750 [Bacillus thuringiensis serovar leesis]